MWGPDSKWVNAGNQLKYIAFAEKYVSVMVGQRKLNAFYKKYPTKTLFDKIDPSDEAFAMLVVKNNQKLWYEQYCASQKNEDKNYLEIAKEMSEHEGDTNETTKKTRPEWTGQKAGTKNKYLSTGWSDEGMTYYNKMVEKFQKKQKHATQRKMLNTHWKEHFAKSSKHVLSLLSPRKQKEMMLGEEFDEEPAKPAPVYDWTPNSDDEEVDGQVSTPI